MKLSVMQFETSAECKAMASKFVAFVANQFDAMGCELNERIAWPSGKTLKIDKAYLKNWLAFESKGYKTE